MKLFNPAYLSLFVLVVIIWSACSSGKSAYEHGNYYDAVITAVNRLRRNTDNKKSSETLRAAYPMAVKYYDDKANAAIASTVEFKWREVVSHYTTLQSMHDEIQRSPGALQVIPNPNNYQAKLTEARQKAAEESYHAGIMALGIGDRANAKKAYYLFINANDYASGYKDVVSKIEEARSAATVKVVVDPIPVVAKNYALDAHYFDSKLNEYLKANQTNEFVRYYKAADAKAQKINPDHIVQLSFEEFSIGQVYLNEKESQVEKDSIIVAYAYTDTKGATLRKDTEAPKIVPVVTVGAATTTNTTNNTTVNSNTTNTTNTNTTTNNTTTNTTNNSTTNNTSNSNTTNTNNTNNTTTNNNTSNATTTTTQTSTPDTKTTNTNTQTNNQDTKTTTSEQGNSDVKTEEKKPEEKKPEENKQEEKKDQNQDTKPDEKKEEQVTICHQPPGKSDERKTMTVPQSAVKAHMAHGDVMGECKAEKKDDKGKSNKGNDGGGGMASVLTTDNSIPVMIASASNTNRWYLFAEENVIMDTIKVYGKVKATVRHFKKTITSRGVLNFRIVDAKTKAVISEQRMPSESVWISEWLTYNGDSRALAPEQAQLATKRELPPPTNQDLFTEFAKPLFDQISNKITEFYKSY